MDISAEEVETHFGVRLYEELAASERFAKLLESAHLSSWNGISRRIAVMELVWEVMEARLDDPEFATYRFDMTAWVAYTRAQRGIRYIRAQRLNQEYLELAAGNKIETQTWRLWEQFARYKEPLELLMPASVNDARQVISSIKRGKPFIPKYCISDINTEEELKQRVKEASKERFGYKKNLGGREPSCKKSKLLTALAYAARKCHEGGIEGPQIIETVTFVINQRIED